jgi:hypothetical protein
MSQRDSGYARRERDCYETPEWVTLALIPHLPKRVNTVWEPACASGKMVSALKSRYAVVASDIVDGVDFFQQRSGDYDAIVTNPPYSHAAEFIDYGITLTAKSGVVAMLLRTDFDHAASRSQLFGIPQFAKKLVLRKRIKWFEDSDGSPSFNHAWFIWDWLHSGPPVLAYAP